MRYSRFLKSIDIEPFDVNVTTSDPGVDAISRDGSADNIFGTRVVFTVDNFGNCGCGGFAYLRAFDDTTDYYKPAFVFNRGVKSAGEAATHEAGHNLGLNHDGVIGGSAYYGGHGSGETGWAPIMGVGYNRALVQWSQGEYSGSNNGEDDLARMQTYGAPLVTDDHGNSIGSATPLDTGAGVGVGEIALQGRGVIHTRTDRDVFLLLVGAGPLELSVSPSPSAPNLDVESVLYDAGGAEIARSNAFSALTASLTVNVAAGQYFLAVNGVGEGDPLSTGYTDYGSLGNYHVSGSASDPGGLASPTAVAAAPGYAASFAPLLVNFDGSASIAATAWMWDFGDGASAGGQLVSHTYDSPGSYDVTLTVSGQEGLTDSDGLVVTVNNQKPLAAASVDSLTAAPGELLTFDGSASYDPDSSGSIVAWEWRFGDGSIDSGEIVSHSYTSGGSFVVELTVTDNLGDTASTVLTVGVTGPSIVEQFADAEQTLAGSVNGDLGETFVTDASEESITEVESGGRKRIRFSYLEHSWYFDVIGGDSVTLWVTGRHVVADDGESMRFFYSLDGGLEVPLDIALDDIRRTLEATLPTAGGRARLIVRDSDRSGGNRGLDRLFVDALVIVTENGGGDSPPPPPPPPQPEGIVLEANGYKVKGQKTVDLSWQGIITGGVLYRDGASIADVNGSGYTDSLGKGGGTYGYMLCDSSGACSATVTVIF